MSAPASTREAQSDPVLSARGMVKQYPGVRAVDGVDLDLRPGEIHGLVGENGAGKSTLIKLLTGAVGSDGGSIRVDGRHVTFHGPRDALAAGIVAVHQEPSLVPRLSPAANAFLGAPLCRFGVLRRREMNKRFSLLGRELNLDLPDRGVCGSLSVATQQQIEIVRALQRNARILVLDEPTAALGQSERATLLRTITSLKGRGAAVLYISHHLDEVLEICDAVTVMRCGRRITTAPVGALNHARLVEAMVGRAVVQVQRRSTDGARGHERHGAGSRVAPRLAVTGVRSAHVNIDHFGVGAGEIVGLAGLVGSGRSSFLRLLAGWPPDHGTMHIDGRPVTWPASPAKAQDHGIALAPEDRRTQGLILGMTSSENVLLPARRSIAAAGIVRMRKRSAARVADLAAAVQLAPAKIGVRTRTLSGGNQQKVVLAKLLGTRPRILLIDEPMRGIDVGAKAEIFDVIAAAAAAGAAVIIASEETDDLLAFCDRVLVMWQGQLIVPDTDATDAESAVYNAMLGIRGHHQSHSSPAETIS
ncbi:sugar ABC transporter ATP-binding protein [Gordonia sp. NPDC003376]